MPLPAIRSRVLGLLGAAALLASVGPAFAASGWYCDPLQAFYPAVRSCPTSWRLSSQTAATHPAPEAEALPPAPKPPADPGGKPIFQAPPSLARGDQLDEWCKGMTTAINLAVCRDDELRRLALERLRAFNEANARVSPEQRSALAADQNGWALSYPQGCGLTTAAAPALPLAPSVKECLAQAGRKRLAYLRAYGHGGGAEMAADAAAPANSPTPATAQLKPDAAQPKPDAPPAESQAQPKASAPLVRIPPAQQDQPAAQPQPPLRRTEPSRPEEKPVSSPLPTAVKIGALLIAFLVVGLWLVSGVRRFRRGRSPDAA